MLDHPFKRQPHKMVKHPQTVRREQPRSCLSVLDHFVGLSLKGLITTILPCTYLISETLYIHFLAKR